ncbi:MAG: ATP-binding protein, partial [Lachnospiraceae bacterium]|nr:ATP-binding protein [Lachnospiraceae bacterium]
YSDDNGLEIDAIYQLADGRYALIEIKNSLARLQEAEKNLTKFKDLIIKHNEKALENKEHPGVIYREPSAMILVCANLDMAFTTESGIKIVPIGCLK